MSVAIGQVESEDSKSLAKDVRKKNDLEKEEQLRREIEIYNLILSAKSQTVEISADILFPLLDAKLLKEPRKKEELIEYIFRRAPEAKESFRMSFRQGIADTRAGYRAMAYDLKLDKLSIQLRAVTMMIPINRLKARQLFQEIPPLKLNDLTCDDDLEYNVSEFYKVLKEIVEKTFDVESRQRREHIYFAASYVDAVVSPHQLVPVLDFLSSLNMTRNEFALMLNAFIYALGRVSGDPRSVAFSLKHAGLSTEIKFKLLNRTEEGGAQQIDLLNSYRKYIIKNLSSSQCADNLFTGTADNPHPIISAANTLFKTPITEDDIRPGKVESRSAVYYYWRSPKAVKLLADAKELRFGSSKNELTKQERSTPEWHTSLLRFLADLADWHPEDEDTEADYFHQKSVLYNGLIQMVSDEMRVNILIQFGLFVRDSSMQRDAPAEWLNYAKILLRTGKTLSGRERNKFFDTLNASGSQIFPMYSELDRLQSLPAKPSDTRLYRD